MKKNDKLLDVLLFGAIGYGLYTLYNNKRLEQEATQTPIQPNTAPDTQEPSITIQDIDFVNRRIEAVMCTPSSCVPVTAGVNTQDIRQFQGYELRIIGNMGKRITLSIYKPSYNLVYAVDFETGEEIATLNNQVIYSFTHLPYQSPIDDGYNDGGMYARKIGAACMDGEKTFSPYGKGTCSWHGGMA